MSTQYDWYEHQDDEFAEGDIDEEREDEERWICLFPGRCCMPAEHTNDECHTPEMAEEYFREQGL